MRWRSGTLRMLGAVLLAALCAGGNCTIEVSSDHDCDDFDHDPDDHDCDCPQDASPPPPWVFAFVAVDPDGTTRHGYAWVERGGAR